MAGTDKFEDLHLSDLSLEPLPDPNLLNYQPPRAKAQLTEQKAHKGPESRNKKVEDRRIATADRRKVLRFEADRRSGKERRPKKTWGPGTNI
jgi:hypothetical protein